MPNVLFICHGVMAISRKVRENPVKSIILRNINALTTLFLK